EGRSPPFDRRHTPLLHQRVALRVAAVYEREQRRGAPRARRVAGVGHLPGQYRRAGEHHARLYHPDQPRRLCRREDREQRLQKDLTVSQPGGFRPGGGEPDLSRHRPTWKRREWGGPRPPRLEPGLYAGEKLLDYRAGEVPTADRHVQCIQPHELEWPANEYQ